MARVCVLTGKATKSGHNRSHSMRATKRTFVPNLITRWVELPTGEKMKVRVSAKAYKKLRGFI